jgi:CheY-like chemotaxis protein
MKTIRSAVVCVDDDPYILQMLSLQLRKCVDTDLVLLEFFLDPKQVTQHLDALKEEGINVNYLITDFRMHSMNGYELIRAVKSKFIDVKCILLSGQADRKLVQDLEKAGLLDAFVSKPWKEKDLFSLLNCCSD